MNKFRGGEDNASKSENRNTSIKKKKKKQEVLMIKNIKKIKEKR